MRRGANSHAVSVPGMTSAHLVPHRAVRMRAPPKHALPAMLRPTSKNQSPNPGRRARTSISATMRTKMICQQRCRRNSDQLRQASPPRQTDHRAPIRRRGVATKEIVPLNLAGRNRGAPNHAETNLGQNRHDPNRLAPSDVTSRGPNASRRRSATNQLPAHRATPVTIAPANGAANDHRAKIVLPSPNRVERNNLAQNSHDQLSRAPNDQLVPSVLPANDQLARNVLPVSVRLLHRARSASISPLASASAAPSRLQKSLSPKSQSPKSPSRGHLLPSRPASPRKNSPRPQQVPRSLRSPVWA
jgi:hypothetical protein